MGRLFKAPRHKTLVLFTVEHFFFSLILEVIFTYVFCTVHCVYVCMCAIWRFHPHHWSVLTSDPVADPQQTPLRAVEERRTHCSACPDDVHLFVFSFIIRMKCGNLYSALLAKKASSWTGVFSFSVYVGAFVLILFFPQQLVHRDLYSSLPKISTV